MTWTILIFTMILTLVVYCGIVEKRLSQVEERLARIEDKLNQHK